MEYVVKKIKIKDWENYDKGIILAENDEYLLTAYMPVDYVVDGYRLYLKKYIEKSFEDDETKTNQKVLNYRQPGIFLDVNLDFSIRDIAKYLVSKFEVIELIYSEDESFFITRVGDKHYDIDFIDPYGQVSSLIPIEFKEIEHCISIGIKTDYLDALFFLKRSI